jgi:hypothetical protein
MKHFIFWLAVLATSLLHGQEFKGIAVYESKTSLKDVVSESEGKVDPELEKCLWSSFPKPWKTGIS